MLCSLECYYCLGYYNCVAFAILFPRILLLWVFCSLKCIGVLRCINCSDVLLLPMFVALAIILVLLLCWLWWFVALGAVMCKFCRGVLLPWVLLLLYYCVSLGYLFTSSVICSLGMLWKLWLIWMICCLECWVVWGGLLLGVLLLAWVLLFPGGGLKFLKNFYAILFRQVNITWSTNKKINDLLYVNNDI